MTYPMRDLSLLACSLALLAACGDNGGNTTDTASSTTAGSTGGTGNATEPTASSDPSTTDTPTSVGPTTGSPTGDPTTDNPTTQGPTTTDPTATGTGTTSEDTTTGAPVCPYTPVDGMPQFALELIASGFDRPVLTLPHPKQPDRLFVVEQGGHIKILEPGETMAPPDSDDFLYVQVKGENNTEIGSEQGLLGFAFHPNFPDDPRVYINYQAQPGDGRTLVDLPGYGFANAPKAARANWGRMTERYLLEREGLERILVLVDGERHPGFAPRALRALISRAGLEVQRCEVACREPKKPHFQVVLAVAGKASRAPLPRKTKAV